MSNEQEQEKINLFFLAAEIFLLSIFHLARLLSLFLPPAAMQALFEAFGAAIYYGRPRMRHNLETKISDALPEITDSKTVERIARHACGSFLHPMFDLLMLARHGGRIMSGLEVSGLEHLEEADAMGKGVLMLFAHFGSFDIFAPVMARYGKPFTPIIFNPFDTPVPRYISTLSLFGQRLGCDREFPVFWVGVNIKEKVMGHLARGKRVGITFDVDGTCIVDLFGRPAALADGIARFAINSGAPILPFTLMQGEKPLDLRLTFFEPLRYELTGDRHRDIDTIMREVVRAGEEMVRQDPGQWMSWFGLWHWWDRAEELAAGELKESGERPIPEG
jgi:phosphatidylinositol dimannoside acyltransferase